MTVFISYSHEDCEFVDQLFMQLLRHRVHIWLDRCEMKVGESLTSRIEDAITRAGALLVVLSKASVKSDWCRRELNAGLMRELKERQILVLPVLKEDCDIPLFLQDKLYADFRANPEEGLKDILESLASITNDTQGRVVAPKWHTDWSIDWMSVNFDNEITGVNTRLTIVEQAENQPYIVLSTINIFDPSNHFINYELACSTFQTLVDSISDEPHWSVILEDQFEVTRPLQINRPNGTGALDVMISVRRLGEDTGKDILFHVGQQIQQIGRQISERSILRNSP